MFKIFGSLLNGVVGIFSKNSEAKNKLKQVKLDGEIRMAEAKVEAEVKRINANTQSDNNIDYETVKDMKTSWKDELLVITFVTPIFVLLNVVPFIAAADSKNWTQLPSFIKQSVEILNSFPDWYKWAIALIFVATLGFRSLLRKVFDKYLNKRL